MNSLENKIQDENQERETLQKINTEKEKQIKGMEAKVIQNF